MKEAGHASGTANWSTSPIVWTHGNVNQTRAWCSSRAWPAQAWMAGVSQAAGHRQPISPHVSMHANSRSVLHHDMCHTLQPAAYKWIPSCWSLVKLQHREGQVTQQILHKQWLLELQAAMRRPHPGRQRLRFIPVCGGISLSITSQSHCRHVFSYIN